MKKKILMIALLSTVSGVAFAVTEGNGEYVHAPEINPASLGSALTLLIGGLTVLKSRFSRK